MNQKALKRGFLMITGIMSVVVIVLSHVFYEPIEPLQKKVATEQSSNDHSTDDTAISAPSDIVSHGNAVAFNQPPVWVNEKLADTEIRKRSLTVIKKAFVSFFNTLFRVIISPNAP
jgi:ABC-type transport system involved in cytochrome bd biosynthesis fused ATPase/permease subunit